LLGHRAVHRHRHRHGVAVLGDLRQVEADLAFGRRLAAGELLDQVLRVVGGVCRADRCAEARHRERAGPDRQSLPPIVGKGHVLHLSPIAKFNQRR
jgi:hypothetical protein